LVNCYRFNQRILCGSFSTAKRFVIMAKAKGLEISDIQKRFAEE